MYRVPYAGFKGDYQSILVLNPAASAHGNPLLRQTLSLGPSGPAAIEDVNEEVWVLFHLDHQARRVRAEVFDATTGRAWGRAADFQYIERTPTATPFFAVPFDGMTTRGASGRPMDLANGQYVIKLSVLKALGDDANPAHRETWTSPVITIARP